MKMRKDSNKKNGFLQEKKKETIINIPKWKPKYCLCDELAVLKL